MQTLISIIIPCYNHGNYVQEAIDSIKEYKNHRYEIIIVNDGSTDLSTINKLHELKESGYNVLSHANKGLGYTRNRGICAAKGKYILPLDADNKITHEYISESLQILERNEADIVYGNPIFFGEEDPHRHFKTRSFNGLDLFFTNYIDACAVFRRSVWETVNGFDENMPYQGNEDWEFWLNAYISGFKFQHLNKDLYYYRVVKDSMIARTINSGKNHLNYTYMVRKHAEAFSQIIPGIYSYNKMYERDINNPIRSVFKYLYKSFQPKSFRS